MVHFNQILALVLLAALTVVSGAMHGKATLRWGTPIELEHAAERLQLINLEVGNWKLEERQAFDEQVLQVLQSVGSLKHIYKNKVTDQIVAVAIFVGPTGPMVAHTPIICYPATAYEFYSGPTAVAINGSDGSKHELLAATFRVDNVNRNYLRVYYGWATENGAFTAPSNPRSIFANETFVYRLQLATPLELGQEDNTDDSALQFLRQSIGSNLISLFKASN